MFRTTAAILLMSTALMGCTSLAVRPLDSSNNEPARGYQYSLPYAYYKVSVVRTLKECVVVGSDATFSFDVSVSATPMFGPDTSQTFVIDNASLVNWFKTSQLSVERFENGMLKSVGASATDHTGSALSSAAGGVVKLAQAALVGGIGGTDDRRPSPCNQKLIRIANGLDAKRSAMNIAAAAVEAETEKLKLMKEASSPFGSGSSPTTQDRLLTQVSKLIDKTASSSRAQSAYQNDVDAITDTHTFHWPPNGRTMEGTFERQDRNWLNRFVAKNAAGVTVTATDFQDIATLKIVASVRPAVAGGHGVLPLGTTGGTLGGIRYRDPVIGVLQVSLCKDIGSNDVATCDASSKPVKLAEGPVPQLGRLMVISYDNYIFQDNEMKATFSEDGRLLTASHGEKASRAKVASDTLSAIADTLLEGTKTLRTAGVDSKTAMLKAKKGLLEEQAALEEAQLALLPKTTSENDRRMAILASDTALREALLKNLQAKQALDQARSAQP